MARTPPARICNGWWRWLAERVSAAKVAQHADLGDVMDMLGQHRRDEAHDRHRFAPVGGPRLERRLGAQPVDGRR